MAEPLSPFEELRQSGGVRPEEWSLVQGMSPTDAMNAIVANRRAERARAQKAFRNRPQIQSIGELIALSQQMRGVPREIAVPLLQRLMGMPSEDRATLAGRQAAAREQTKAMFARRNNLDPDLVGAIGTPDFQTRVRDAAQSGAIDRQSLQTLYNLDQQERAFAAKNRAKPGKLSPAAQKLRELDALGIPITEDTVRGVYVPTAIIPSPIDPTRRNRPISLSALAGLTGGASTEEEAPIEESPGASEIDVRRNRMRQVLGGDEY